jgi:hypothetical protein
MYEKMKYKTDDSLHDGETISQCTNLGGVVLLTCYILTW